jgi:hypothetical protein
VHPTNELMNDTKLTDNTHQKSTYKTRQNTQNVIIYIMPQNTLTSTEQLANAEPEHANKNDAHGLFNAVDELLRPHDEKHGKEPLSRVRSRHALVTAPMDEEGHLGLGLKGDNRFKNQVVTVAAISVDDECALFVLSPPGHYMKEPHTAQTVDADNSSVNDTPYTGFKIEIKPNNSNKPFELIGFDEDGEEIVIDHIPLKTVIFLASAIELGCRFGYNKNVQEK